MVVWLLIAYLRAEVPRTALGTPFRTGLVRDLAREVVAIAKANLNLIASDHLPLFDWSDVRDRWERVRRPG